MLFANFNDWSFSRWCGDATAELWRYYMSLSVNEWLIISACFVCFGFLCLRGNMIK